MACAQGSARDSTVAARRLRGETISDSAAVHEFVQTFYDWYQSGKDTDPLWRLMTNGSTYLDPSLATILRADSTLALGSELSPNLIDFDPILFSQDPCPHYEVTQVRRQEEHYLVTVRPVCPSYPGEPQWQTKTPVVDLLPSGGAWRITNIWYPDISPTRNLKAILCEAGGFPNVCS
jgi:hypothetical protein